MSVELPVEKLEEDRFSSPDVVPSSFFVRTVSVTESRHKSVRKEEHKPGLSHIE